MQNNIDILNQSDIIWVYSDGQTVDVPIDKEKLKTFMGKIYGVYLGESAEISNWGNYFDNIIVKPSIVGLAEELKNLQE